MTAILAIDPGTTRSAWVALVDGRPTNYALVSNEALLALLVEGVFRRDLAGRDTHVVIEKVASYGMPVGEEVFETVRWAGRFEQAAQPLQVERITRKAVVTHLCGSARAKDPNVRQALIDRFGGSAAIRKGGPLYGITGDLWAALAVAVTYADQLAGRTA